MKVKIPIKQFSGSYNSEDTIFLLKQINEAHTDVREKEKCIQSGVLHYSEMLSHEALPTKDYIALFYSLTEKHGERLASEIVGLADHIHKTRKGPITIVSLLRAGTPIGALINRVLKDRYNRDSVHFSISIIRDRGIDENALRYITRKENRSASSIVFVDGWTAKGVITRELKQAVAKWNSENPQLTLNDTLHVVLDIGGTADVAATREDYAIPSGVLNAPVSGLVSRTVLNDKISPHDFHGTVYYDYLESFDQTNWFLDTIFEKTKRVEPAKVCLDDGAATARENMKKYIKTIMNMYHKTDINKIKPGIAEASRVMKRRVPEVLILKDLNDEDVAHLVVLAKQKNVKIEVDSASPFKATALIADQEGAG